LFIAYIAPTRGEAPGHSEQRNIQVARRDPRILYIEDYQYLGLLFQKVMARLGHRIDLATSGREGLRKFYEDPFDVVVLDYHLPDMTGIDIARELLDFDPELAVVLVTGRGDEQTASKAVSLGISDYLVKDDQNTFLEKLPNVVENLLLEQEKQRQKEEQREALSESESRYRALVESSLQGILVHENYRPLFANYAFARMHGYESSAEICALDSILTLLPEDEKRTYVEATASMQREKIETWDYSHCGVRKDGGTVWLEIRGQEIQWEGNPAVQIVAVDTTGRREAQLGSGPINIFPGAIG
jgi:PAS domain S-box-containing protein